MEEAYLETDDKTAMENSMQLQLLENNNNQWLVEFQYSNTN